MKRQSVKCDRHTPAPAAGAPHRRGSVIILVVGVLAVVAISAVTYVNIVSLDRRSAAAVQRRINYQQQADAVMNHIRSLIGADLFGEKITSNATPQIVNGARVWPRPFEDGDTTDMAYTIRDPNVAPFYDPNGPPANPLGILTLDTMNNSDDAVGARQDPWLASSEPLWLPNNTADTWPQITNLRSGYRYIPPAGNPGALGDWVYDDGKYVDLAQWFIQDQNNRGNPAADLTSFNDPITSAPNDFRLGLDQQIYDLQIDEIEQPFGVFNSRDQRAWVDTDGDLRPDARWQQLEVLGNNGGLIWITAARIIDASALANYNSSIEFSYALPGGIVPMTSDGRTPADIDLWSLLEMADERMQSIANDTRVRGTGTMPGFRQHLENSLLVPDAIQQMTTLDPSYPDINGLTTYMGPWAADTMTLTADQRANYYRFVGSSPLEPAASKGASHSPRRDLIDLCAFWGTNHRSIYSSIEQDIDAFFPPIANTGPNAAKGALRANEDPAQFRSLALNRPTVQAIKADTRRLLTPYSGAGHFSPVPVINASIANGFNEYDQLFSILKPNANLVRATDAEDIFASFVWALAPLATDEPLMRPFTHAEMVSTDFDLDVYHYGAGVAAGFRGPARFITTGDQNAEVGATFAVRTSLALTANMLDCADANDAPTVLRFFPRTVETERAFNDIAGTPAIELSDRLPQGNIRVSTLAYPDPGTSPIVPGDPSVTSAVGNPAAGADYTNILSSPNLADDLHNLKKGLTVVGLERQPFLREVMTAAFYSDLNTTVEENGTEDGMIEFDNINEQIGSMFVAELGNPWDTPIKIKDYIVAIPSSSAELFSTGAGPLPLLFVCPDIEIPAGGVAVLWFHNLPQFTGDAAEAALPGSAGQVVVDEFASVQNVPAASMSKIMFLEHSLSAAMGRLPVVLLRQIEATTSGPHYGIVDKMTPSAPSNAADGFPRALQSNLYITETAGADYIFSDATITNDNPLDTRLLGGTAGKISGRIVVTSSFSRPGIQPGGVSGSFPAYCLELNKGGSNQISASPRLTIDGAYTTSMMAQWGWIVPPMAVGEAALYQNLMQLAANAPEALVPPMWIDVDEFGDQISSIGEPTKIADNAPMNANLANEIPPFQLYCRDGDNAFPTSASVAQLCTFAHMCLNHDLNKINHWKTVSEQLADDRTYDSGAPGGVLNPYMGTLDVSRFILNDTATTMTGAVTNLPDALAVPLGVRVFDCFDTLITSSGLNQGQINLNTAPVEVLAQLPFMWPRLPIADANGLTLNGIGRFDQANIGSSPRLDYLTRYRDANFNVVSPMSTDTPAGLTQIPQMRVATGTGVDYTTPGFVSMGEVAVLDQWTPGQPNAMTGSGLFQSLGTDMQPADGHPFDITTSATGFMEYTPQGAGSNPQDDIEEKLALFRGMVNCASTRSDVYLAWFVVRGYDPDLIESIEVPGTAAEAMNDERFVPTYESRWLCLFDRSNMRRPSDRPRLLMYLELPDARP
ncbi:MAG: hypothetical protein R3B46_10020 [Phycisphaerales bacterium]